jgi:hypothetical protein
MVDTVLVNYPVAINEDGLNRRESYPVDLTI